MAFRQPPLPESQAWLDSLNDELPHVRIEKDNHEISKVCSRARNLLGRINDESSVGETIEMINEMHALNRIEASWRSGPGWAFKTIHRSEISQDPALVINFPEYVQLHQDVWIAYEWNYYRTAKIILHQHLLQCLQKLEITSSGGNNNNISSLQELSISSIHTLVDEILSTVPQSLGDIDNQGNLMGSSQGMSICKGVGGYFLMWPIKIAKSLQPATAEQRKMAQDTFERIRDCTGMKSLLGDASSI